MVQEIPIKPKFKKLAGLSFQHSLKDAVDQYFESNNIKKTGNTRLYIKAVIFFTTFVSLYVVLVFFTPSNFFLRILLWSLFGLNLAAIGFNVMHDACHGSFSSRSWVNNLFGLSLNLMGGYANWWKEKHNIYHHTYTNVDEVDEDINIPFMRAHSHQKRKWFHRYQHFYWFLMYSLLYIAWITLSDFRKYFSNKVGKHKFPKISLGNHIGFWLSKAFYATLFVVIPILVCGWKVWLTWFLVSGTVCGFFIAIVFQLAHIVESTTEPIPKGDIIENEWAIHQVETTANFATKSKFLEWICGGLNFQIEHHLFPRISHVHYSAIQPIVKAKCKEFGIIYNEYPTFLSAIVSHVKNLKRLGTQD